MPISTSRAEKSLIDALARSIRARRILEIGCFKGKTTAVLSRVAQDHDGYVVAIDPMRWASRPANLPEWIDTVLHPFSYERAFWRTLRRRGRPERVRLHRAVSADAALVASPTEHLREFDLAFIDGEHRLASVLADFENWGRRVRPGGKVLFHDCVRRFPDVVEAVKTVAALPGFHVHWPTRGTVAVVDVASPAALAVSP